MSELALYETMSSISAKMAEAARINDWDKLVSLENECTRLARELEQGQEKDQKQEQEQNGQTIGSALDSRQNTVLSNSSNEKTLTKTELERKVALIHQILADDAEVRRHTEPWMEQVKQFLSHSARAGHVRNAYGANSGQ